MPFAWKSVFWGLSVFSVAVHSGFTLADESRPTKFLRMKNDVDGVPQALQTAVVRYKPVGSDQGVVVDLVAAVHIGERTYYESLNERFEDYDVVLYELVAPKNAQIPSAKGRRLENPLSFLQRLPKTMLGLESQLELIDYTKDNFVHADMSPREMTEAMRRRGDDEVTIALSVLVDILRQHNRVPLDEPSDSDTGSADPFEILEHLGNPARMKRVLAEQLSDAGELEQGFGPTMNRILIRDRNEAAVDVLQKEIAKGRKRLAIFYGAAHMPDFDSRLRNQFDLQPTEPVWLSAWDLRKPASEPCGVQELLELFESLAPDAR